MNLPYEPLEALLRARWDMPSASDIGGGDCSLDRLLWSDRAAAQMLGVDPSLVCRWRRDGFTARKADEYATKAGLHPLEVWGNAWLIAEIGADLRRQIETGCFHTEPDVGLDSRGRRRCRACRARTDRERNQAKAAA